MTRRLAPLHGPGSGDRGRGLRDPRRIGRSSRPHPRARPPLRNHDDPAGHSDRPSCPLSDTPQHHGCRGPRRQESLRSGCLVAAGTPGRRVLAGLSLRPRRTRSREPNNARRTSRNGVSRSEPALRAGRLVRRPRCRPPATLPGPARSAVIRRGMPATHCRHAGHGIVRVSGERLAARGERLTRRLRWGQPRSAKWRAAACCARRPGA